MAAENTRLHPKRLFLSRKGRYYPYTVEIFSQPCADSALDYLPIVLRHLNKWFGEMMPKSYLLINPQNWSMGRKITLYL